MSSLPEDENLGKSGFSEVDEDELILSDLGLSDDNSGDEDDDFDDFDDIDDIGEDEEDFDTDGEE